MEEKVNEKVIIISAKDLIKEKCIISYIESLTAGNMVSLVIEDPDRRLTDNILLAIASSDRIKNLEIKGNFRYKCVVQQINGRADCLPGRKDWKGDDSREGKDNQGKSV